jgi:hypothetical protein
MVQMCLNLHLILHSKFGFKRIVNKRKQKIKTKEKEKKRRRNPAWASDSPFGPPEETTRAAHEATYRAPTLPNRLTGGPGLAALAR